MHEFQVEKKLPLYASFLCVHHNTLWQCAMWQSTSWMFCFFLAGEHIHHAKNTLGSIRSRGNSKTTIETLSRLRGQKVNRESIKATVAAKPDNFHFWRNKTKNQNVSQDWRKSIIIIISIIMIIQTCFHVWRTWKAPSLLLKFASNSWCLLQDSSCQLMMSWDPYHEVASHISSTAQK